MTMDLQDNKQNVKSPPDKWRKKESKSRPGKYYFYNVKTNATAWTLPEGAVLEKSRMQDDVKAGSKRKSQPVLPAHVKKEKKILQLIGHEKSFTVPRGSQRNKVAGKQEEAKIICSNTTTPSEDVAPAKIRTSALQESVPSDGQSLIMQPSICQVQSVSASNSILNKRKKRNRRKKKKSIDSTGTNLAQGSSSATGVRCSEPGAVENMKCIASEESSRSGDCTASADTQFSKPGQSNVNRKIQPEQTYQITCESGVHPFPLGIKLGSKHDLPLSSPSICSSNDVTALSGACCTEGRGLVENQPDILQSNFKSNQNRSSFLPLTEKICLNIPHNVPRKLEVHDSFKEVNESDKDIPDKKINKTPAQARLKRLQRSHSEKPSKEKILKVDCKASIVTGAATKRLAMLQSTLQSDLINNKILKDNVMHVENEFDGNSSKSSQLQFPTAPYCVPNNLDCMDIEYMESEVLEDIDTLRQDSQELSHPNMFMEVDINFPLSLTDSLYIVLDTNILLSHLKFVEGLRDTILPGNVLIHLYLPWQVLQELDHLKDKGKRNIQTLARSAIKFLHDNFSHKHPRICGQKLSEATKTNFSSPDDSILQSCIQLKEEGYPVVLLSNDINLCNKALVCDVKALTKDQFVREYTDSSDCLSNSVQDKKLQTSTSHSDLHHIALCEMKALVKDTLCLVVSKGMEDVFGHLWKKRSLIPPPWEIDDVLTCLAHHWLSVCDSFIPKSVQEIILKLRNFIKTLSKGGGASVLELSEAVELTISLFQALPIKYSSSVQVAIENAKVLKSRLGEKSSLVESAKAPNHSDQLLGNQCPMVLFCFEQAHSAAQSLCNSEPFSDPDWIAKAQAMLQSVQQLIHLIKLVLSLPIESLNDKTLELKELACLIGGTTSITSGDLAEFCKQNQNRILLENGIHQFISFENLLSNKLLSEVV